MVLRHANWRSVLICAALLASSLQAQQPAGTVAGLVTDALGAVVAGAQVTVLNQATHSSVRTTTTASGAYRAPGLLPGLYAVRVEAPGFKNTVVQVLVEVGRDTVANVRLQVGTVAEAVTVKANAVQINATQSALEGVVTQELMRAVPLNGRNFLELGQLEPGVQINSGGTLHAVAGYNTAIGIGGQSGLQTAVTLDGLNISDDHFGAVLANVSQEAIQEFQITRSGQDISTGLTGNGAVNIVTKSGGNQVHGSGLFYWRDDKLAARIAEQPVPFDREHVGFSAGGPFRRDRLFWFASYERIGQNIGVATVTPVFPQFTRMWHVPYHERMAMGRVDANLGTGLRVFARFSHNDRRGVQADDSFGASNIVPVSAHDFTNQTAVGFDADRGRFTHAVRFGYFNSNLRDEMGNAQIEGLPLTLDPAGRPLTVTVGDALHLGTNGNTPSYRFIDNYETRYDGGISFGRHSIRWGALTNIIRSNWYDTLNATPGITLEATADFQRRCGSDPLCYPLRGGSAGNGLGWMTDIPALGFPYGGFKNNRIHAYIAEGWRATPRLQMNFGLRWAYEPGANLPDLVKPALLDEFQPGMSGPVKQDTTNFAPQIGLAWDPTGGGKWAVRVSAGVYYDNFLLRNNWWIRNNLTRAPIANVNANLNGLVDPNTNKTIFALNGSDPTALVTPGVNWLSGPQCNDPRLPPGNCALGTPGLLDAVLQAAAEYRAASQLLAQGTSKESNCERNRNCQLMDPHYRTPYTLQFTAGVQRELRPGLVLSVDYVRHRGQRFPMRTNLNRVGAADTLNLAKATAAIVATNKSLGCGATASAAAINCAIGKGATIQTYASKGLATLGGGIGAAKSTAESTLAFGGLNPKFNRMIVYRSSGWSTYNALQVHVRGRLPDVGRGLHNWSLVSSYSLGRLVGTVAEQGLIWLQEDDYKFMYGPTSLDRTHIFSLASGFDTFLGLRLNSFWRASSALSQSVYLQPVSSVAGAEIFTTDLNGDGTGGDPLPGTNRGSYGRDAGCGATALNRLIDAYNGTQAGQITPAGQALVNAGLFTTGQLESLGAVSPTVPRAPEGQVCLDSLVTTDVRISRPFKLAHERITIEPAFELFNVFNVANFDLPASRLTPVLTGLPGSINGTTRENRTNRAGVTGGTMSLGAPRSWQVVLRISF